MRPTYGAAEATFALPGGAVRVHYVTTTADAVPAGDADGDGVPDFVAEVAARGDQALAAYAALGMRAPLGDGDLGGDGRVDVYLRDLQLADGSFGIDACDGARCAGFVIAENDFAGYAYPSASIGIRVLASHELFHAVQAAYDTDEPIAWSEGSAVWAEEHVFPEQGDFEGLTAAFLARPYRPFDRPGAGFGDLYPYGAALWPYFLEQRFGADLIAEIWAGCETDDFLDATDAALAAHDSSLHDAWIEFTRWNAHTGAHADPGEYPDSARFADALREDALAVPGTVTLSIEGLSARYLPLDGVDGPLEVTVDADLEIAVAQLGDELVVTGVTPTTTARDVTITVDRAPPDDAGCSASGVDGIAMPFVVLIALAFTRRGGTRWPA